MGRARTRREWAGRQATSGYDAFISYSHALDGALARALQTGLERFARPWYRSRALRVFRDTTSLSANPGLWSSIENALASSAWLVLMASPDAAQSPWVNREVTWWLENKSPQRMLVVLTEGEFRFDGDSEHGDGTRAALPPALRGAYAEEPRWVDLRWLHDVDQLDQSNPQLRECVADVAAAVHEVPKDVVVGEHIRQHRRTMLLARSGVAALVVLLISAVVAAALAVVQWNRALEQARIATGRQLVTQADTTRNADPRTALLLGIAAQRIHPDPQTRASLVTTLTTTYYSGTLTGHPGPVESVALSPDGHTLAAIGRDLEPEPKTAVTLWDLTNPTRPIRRAIPLTDHTRFVHSIAFSPDGHTLATSDIDGTVILWDLTNPTRPIQRGTPLTGHNNTVESMAFSPDGRILSTGSDDHTVTMWDLAEPTRRSTTLTGHTEAVESVAFSPDGRTLATGSRDKTVILWDLTNPTLPTPRGAPLTGYTGPVHAMVFSPDGRTLTTASLDYTIHIDPTGSHNNDITVTAIVWDLTNPTQPTQRGTPLKITGRVYSIALSADGHTLATAGVDQEIVLWDLTDPAAIRRDITLTGHSSIVRSMVFSPEGRTLATGSDDHTVIFWDLSSPGRRSTPLTGHTNAVSSVAFSPDGRTLATASQDYTVILWNVTDPARPGRRSQLTGHDSTVSSVAFSPDGHTLATGGFDTNVMVMLWDLTDPARPTRRVAPLAGHTGMVDTVAFSPDGRTLAVASLDVTATFDGDASGPVTLWNLTDPTHPTRLRIPLARHNGNVNAAAFSPDRHTLATAIDNTVVWDNLTDPSRHVPPLTGHTGTVKSVAFSPDGRILATASEDKTVMLWDLTDPTHPARLGPSLTGYTGFVSSVAFSPDGRTLASASGDHTVMLWDLTDPTHPARLGPSLTGHTGSVNAVAFSPDGRTLASASGDRTVRLWDLTDLNDLRDHAANRACSITGRGLNHDEWVRYIPGLAYQDTCPA